MKKHRFIALKIVIAGLLVFAPSSALAETKTLEPTKDTYIDEGLPTSSFGSIGLGTVSYQPSGELLRIMLLQFDVSSIPAGSTITSATLKMRVGGCIGSGATGGITLGAFMNGSSSGWSESSTYNSVTGTGGSYETFGTATVACSAGSYTTMDVREAVSYWVDRTIPNDGLVLVPVQTGATYWTRVFYTSEAAAGSRPVLTVNYDVPYEEVTSPDGGPASSAVAATATNTTTAASAPQPLAADTTLAAPQQLVASQKEDPLAVALSWKKSATQDNQGYALYRKKGSGAYEKIADTKPDVLSYTDKDVQRGQSYSYLVRAVRNAKESESSPVATIKVGQKAAVATTAKASQDQRLVIGSAALISLIIIIGGGLYYRLHRKHKALVHKHAKASAKTKS